ncbi:hypothetical protein [Flavobacterium sp. K5-23]|uniref:hypothetical protein n=1 Tax=Flavobacterium sp. K5-23 TaxID=2746225 RepID=UPI00200FC893|nr:hypothetical protein [Flavobacterium sp. K5-23]UQD55360.1 hypothetical protein FLAK523_02695 [Flavobacterium sp. K5-23]
MKKRLEADLISIAHRILKIRNKSDINQLHLETQKLYEKLSVLRFVEEHYGEIKPTIGLENIENEIEEFFDNTTELPVETVIEMTESNMAQEIDAEEEVIVDVVEETIENEVEEETIENESPITGFEADLMELQIDPEEALEDDITSENLEEENETETDEEIDAVELSNEESLIFEEEVEETEDIEDIEESLEEDNDKFETAIDFSKEIETTTKPEAVQISFEDLLGGNYNDTFFVKVDDVEPALAPIVFDAVEEEKSVAAETKKEEKDAKIVSLNDKLSKGIDIDLNDRIAFVKHLFGNNSEDYNRVLNQLITFDNFHETRNFIEEMVKPDYNNWEGKEDYEDRFMEIIEKKFL